jgi:hypothetical protein
MSNGELSNEEIQIVMNDARNPIYDNQNFLFCYGDNLTHLSIIRKSTKGLILIEGNQATGFTHIHNRHELYSNFHYWNDEGKLDNPSKFSIYSVPIDSYPSIADDLYCLENLCCEKNKHKDKFDLYIGQSETVENKSVKYRLLLYKDTKIIHTLFPDNGDKSKPKKVSHFNYVKGNILISIPLIEEDVVNFEIPYLNLELIERYRFIIRRNYSEHNERIYLQVNSSSGIPFIVHLKGERPILERIKNEVLANFLEYNDLLTFQKIIMEYENNRISIV